MDTSLKSLFVFFLVVGVALVGYATVLFDDSNITGELSFGRSRSRSYYRPPVYTTPPPVAQPVPVPQVSPAQWAMSTIQNVVANAQNYESCTSTCKPTLLNLCINNKIQGGSTEFCTSLANSYEYVCSGSCRTKFPATPQQAVPRQNPDVWANQLIQSYVKVQQDVNFCKNNCFQTVQGNCIGQRILTDANACAQLAAKYVPGCQGACQIEFSQRAQRAASPPPQTPQQPVQQTPAMQYAECAKKCVQSRAQSETECFAQQPPTATVEEKQKTCERPVTLIYNNCMDKTGCLTLYRALQSAA